MAGRSGPIARLHFERLDSGMHLDSGRWDGEDVPSLVLECLSPPDRKPAIELDERYQLSVHADVDESFDGFSVSLWAREHPDAPEVLGSSEETKHYREQDAARLTEQVLRDVVASANRLAPYLDAVVREHEAARALAGAQAHATQRERSRQ